MQMPEPEEGRREVQRFMRVFGQIQPRRHAEEDSASLAAGDAADAIEGRDRACAAKAAHACSC